MERNLSPHRPAMCAMWLYADRYTSQKGGLMDFWDKLSESDKATCRRMAEQIVTTRPEAETGCSCGYPTTFDTVVNKSWCSLCKKHC